MSLKPGHWSSNYATGSWEYEMYNDREAEVLDWCQLNIPNSAENLRVTITGHRMNFRFKHKEDYTIFVLRWA